MRYIKEFNEAKKQYTHKDFKRGDTVTYIDPMWKTKETAEVYKVLPDENAIMVETPNGLCFKIEGADYSTPFDPHGSSADNAARRNLSTRKSVPMMNDIISIH
jgi:hypothetical protein